MYQRERTPFEIIYYATYLVCLKDCLFELRREPLSHSFIHRSHKSVWEWTREIGSDRSFQRLFRLGRKKVKVFAMDETGIKVGSRDAFLFHRVRAVRGTDSRIVSRLDSQLHSRGTVSERSYQEIREASGVDGRRGLVPASVRIHEPEASRLSSP
jgi:hypothetical protein